MDRRYHKKMRNIFPIYHRKVEDEEKVGKKRMIWQRRRLRKRMEKVSKSFRKIYWMKIIWLKCHRWKMFYKCKMNIYEYWMYVYMIINICWMSAIECVCISMNIKFSFVLQDVIGTITFSFFS